tara:strand:- start:164 stop:676 length:513 start_codon:yes stop_codon:yes gene_type:complete
MRPVSNNAFSDVLINYADSLWDMTTTAHAGRTEPATLVSLLNIGNFVDPKRINPDKFENFIEDMVLRMYENTSTIMKLKKYLEFKLKEWPESEKAVWWKIGESWEIKETGQKGDCYYPDSESFLENVDYNFAVQIIKKCWERACSTGEIFPEGEAIKDYAKNNVNGWILD